MYKRLDIAVAKQFKISRRQAKEAIRQGRVLVNGKNVRQGSFFVQESDDIRFLSEDYKSFTLPLIRIIKEERNFAAISKPEKIHSAKGKDKQNIEENLSFIFPNKNAQLLNRLDFLTSGILIIAFNSQAKEEYSYYQSQGKTVKIYLAKVWGVLTHSLLIKWQLDVKKRKKVKVIKQEERSSLRFTWVEPIFQEQDTTVVKVKILKGKRHQIRAHLASVGHPIVGDNLYLSSQDTTSSLFLHHTVFSMPGFKVIDKPSWLSQSIFSSINF